MQAPRYQMAGASTSLQSDSWRLPNWPVFWDDTLDHRAHCTSCITGFVLTPPSERVSQTCTMFVHFHLSLVCNIHLHRIVQLRHIIHDWADAEALTILRNVRKALAPHSRVLVRMCSILSVPLFYYKTLRYRRLCCWKSRSKFRCCHKGHGN